MLLTGAMQPLHLDGDVEQTTLLALAEWGYADLMERLDRPHHYPLPSRD